MALLNYGTRLAPIRTGRFADGASSLAWVVGVLLTYLHPAGLFVAGVLLALTASSVERAFAAGAAFGITVAGLGSVWLLLTGSPPVVWSHPPEFVVLSSLAVPPGVAVTVRALG